MMRTWIDREGYNYKPVSDFHDYLSGNSDKIIQHTGQMNEGVDRFGPWQIVMVAAQAW